MRSKIRQQCLKNNIYIAKLRSFGEICWIKRRHVLECGQNFKFRARILNCLSVCMCILQLLCFVISAFDGLCVYGLQICQSIFPANGLQLSIHQPTHTHAHTLPQTHVCQFIILHSPSYPPPRTLSPTNSHYQWNIFVLIKPSNLSSVRHVMKT